MINHPFLDVYLEIAAGLSHAQLYALVSKLEVYNLRSVTAYSVIEKGVDKIISTCAALVRLVNTQELVGHELSYIKEIAVLAGKPIIEIMLAPDQELVLTDENIHALVKLMEVKIQYTPPYAFMATRIHDDFFMVREAIKKAVEINLGIPCIYFEDYRVKKTLPSVRARTCELIKNASFFVADLTYSELCPNFDSPNTAHEIGIATALNIPIILCAKAPRRNIYFSAGDIDTYFWLNEDDLYHGLSRWLHSLQISIGRRVLNQRNNTSKYYIGEFSFNKKNAYQGPPSFFKKTLSFFKGNKRR